MARMKPPAGAHNVRINGCTPDKDGCIEVANHEVKAFERQGWEVVKPPKPKRRKTKAPELKDQEVTKE